MARATPATSQSLRLPRKLKKDSIVEALWEVRFDSAESNQVPELVVGKLAGYATWNHFRKTRLPISDIPAMVRQQDPSLRHQATLELREADGNRLVKIGSNVFSYHVLSPYCGGAQFQSEINNAISFIFSDITGFQANRFGLRYINIMNVADHKIRSVTDLNIQIKVADENLGTPLNLNYRRVRSPRHWSMVRVASPEFISGPSNMAMTALVDVDVLTPPEFTSEDMATAQSWVREARRYELEDFWRLIPTSIQPDLVEEWAT